MGERDDAKGEIAAARERLSEVVDELARRSSGRYVARQTREAAVRKTSEWTQRARHSPTALGILGGAVGAGIGAAIASRAAKGGGQGVGYSQTEYLNPELEEERWEQAELDLEGDSHQRMTDLRSRASQGKEQLKQKAQGAIESVKGRAENLRQRAPSREQIKGTASGWFQTAVDEQPLLLGAGAILLGLIAGQLFPVTAPEQRAMGPIKEKVREQVSQAQDLVDEKIASSAGLSGSSEPEVPSPDFSGTPPLH